MGIMAVTIVDNHFPIDHFLDDKITFSSPWLDF